MSQFGYVSDESVKIFTEFPHADLEIKSLKKMVDNAIKKPLFIKPGLAIGEKLVIDNAIILDAGCGSGTKAIPLAKFGAKLVLGIDGSSIGIERARALASACQTDNVCFIHDRIEKLPEILKEQSLHMVDMIVNFQNLHHTSDWAANLRLFYDCLRPGGYLVCNIADPTAGRGNFLLKNKIAYSLGTTAKSRLKIGKALFGWVDRKYNFNNISWDAYYADRYSAFYHWIRPGKFVRTISEVGFELVDTFPALYLEHWIAGWKDKARGQRVRKFAFLPMGHFTLQLIMRLRQFFFGGDNRTYYARKPETG